MGRNLRALGAMGVGIGIALASCAELDVIAQKAPGSFARVMELAGLEDSGDRWEAELSGRVSITIEKRRGPYALLVSFDAAPFLAAGFDQDSSGPFSLQGGSLDLWSSVPGSGGLKSPEEAIAAIARDERKRLGWHAALDHYGVDLAPGVMLEWARDPAENDKDLVIVIDPAAIGGPDFRPGDVEGWIYADVEIEREGRKSAVKRLLKPWSLGA